MAFQTKDFLSIVASMVNYMRASQDKITDYNTGSVARTLIEAPAIEMDELYQMMFRGLREAIPVSVYHSFDFGLLPAVGASGTVTFTVSPAQASDIFIPADTVVLGVGGVMQYKTGVDTTILAGATTAAITVYCTKTGLDTNANPNDLTVLQTAIPFVTVTNLNAFSNGRDLETDPERKTRFRDYISTIARGTKAALDYGARTAVLLDSNGIVIERVAAVSIVEPYLASPGAYPPALVWIYIHNGSTGTSAPLVAETQKIIDGYLDVDSRPVPGWKAAGVIVNVYAATELPVTVTGTVTVLSGFDPVAVRADAALSVSRYLSALGIGESAIRSELICKIMDVPGVYNVNLTTPSGDAPALASEKVTAGTVTLT